MTYRPVISQSNTLILFNIKTKISYLTISYGTRDLKPTLVVEKHSKFVMRPLLDGGFRI